jgi:hypothetical protein
MPDSNGGNMPTAGVQSCDLVEIVKISAPYLAALIGLCGVFVAAVLSQRNWLKQYGKQQSVALFEKRLEIAYEVLKNGVAASDHATLSAVNYLMASALTVLNSEGHQFRQETIDNLLAVNAQEDNAQSDALREIVLQGYLVKAMFNENMAERLSRCLALFQELAQIKTNPGKIVEEIKKAFAVGAQIDLVIGAGTQALSEHLSPIGARISEGIAELVNDMLEYAKAN